MDCARDHNHEFLVLAAVTHYIRNLLGKEAFDGILVKHLALR